MVDQVSLTAIGGLSASRNKKLMNFLACGPGPTCGLKDERNEVDVWISVEFVLFRSLGHYVLVLCWRQKPGTDCKRKEQQWTHPDT